MAFFQAQPIEGKEKRPRKKIEEDGYGRLYVLRFTLKDGTVLHKVGMCNTDRTVDRMMEIVRSFFQQYRYTPMVEMRKNKKVVVPYLVETHVHKLLKEWHYTDWDKKFDGSKEFFKDIDEDVLLDYLDEFDYRELLRGKRTMDSDAWCAIEAELEKEKAKESKGKAKGTEELPF